MSRIISSTPQLLALNILAVMLFLCLSFIKAHADPADIHYALPDQLAVVGSLDEHDKFENPFNYVLEELFKRAKLKWKIHEYPASRVFHELKQGNANFSVLVNSNRLDECCLVGKTPMVSSELRVYHKNHVAPISSVDDLKGKEVITIRGYSYGPFKEFVRDPNNRIKHLPTGTHTSAFSMLNKGRANYLLDYSHPSAAVLKKYPIKEIQFEILDTIDFFLVLHRSYPKAKQTMKKLEAIMNEIDVENILSLPSDAQQTKSY